MGLQVKREKREERRPKEEKNIRKGNGLGQEKQQEARDM